MSAGALRAGRRTAALREPLRWYAYVELAVGCSASSSTTSSSGRRISPTIDLSGARAGRRAHACEVDARRASDSSAVDLLGATFPL
jgi:hypothetical protein